MVRLMQRDTNSYTLGSKFLARLIGSSDPAVQAATVEQAGLPALLEVLRSVVLLAREGCNVHRNRPHASGFSPARGLTTTSCVANL